MMRIAMGRRLRMLMLSALLAVSAVLMTFSSFSGGGMHRAYAYAPSDADTAMKAFNAMFWDPNAKFFWSDSKHSHYQGFWVEAELWEMVMDAYLHTTDPALKSSLRTQIDDIFDGTVAKYGADWTNNHFNDDIMWWAMACARAYAITKEPRYLDKAKYYFDFVYNTQWDTSFANGGIWWMNSTHDTKNACINFPAAETAGFLYNITKDTHYLDAEAKIYRWGKTMLTDGDGKVFDRIEVKNGAVPDATHYNQGTFIGAAVGLYKITRNPVYLADAVKAAAYTETHLTDANHLLNYEGGNGDLKGGKTILIRNLAYLQKALAEYGGSDYQMFTGQLNKWLAFNTQMAWNNRNADNIVDGNWSGKLLDGTYESWSSSGAVEALAVIQPVAVSVAYAVKDPYKKIEAEDYNLGKGFITEGSSEGTLQLGGIQPGYYAAYKNVDFGSSGGATGIIARAASATGGGNIEIRLDSLNGPKVGTVNVQGTGGWSNYTDADAVLMDDGGNPVHVTGVHDVYLLFTKTNDQYLFNLDWFRFTKTDPTRTDAYARLKAGHYDGSSGLSKNADWGFLDGIHNNAYAYYKGIDFGSGAAGITVHVQSGNQGGTIDVKLDSLDGPTVGKVDVPAMGNWTDWADVMSNIEDTQAVGVHDLYLVFHGAGGSDYPCNLDWFTFTTVKGNARNARDKLEAEDYTSGTGFGTETGGGETYLAGVYGPNHPYAMYNYVDFGKTSPSKFYVNAASATSGGTIEVRIDGLNGPVIAECTVSGTGGWQNFKVFSADVTAPVTGKHIVFMLFKGSSWLYNFDKFTFGDPSVFTAPPPPPVFVPDHIPPGEVENVQMIRGDDSVRLYWDGPYDVDGKKVEITVTSGGKQVGSEIDVERGFQTAVLPNIDKGTAFTLGMKTVDTSGNVSHGITLDSRDFPSFSLIANDKVLQEGDTVQDADPFIFKIGDHRSAFKSATITVGESVYSVDVPSKQSLTLDMAGNLGEKTVEISLSDFAGNQLQETFKFRVATSVPAMEHLIARFKASGDIRGPLIPQLANALKQAQHQLDLGAYEHAAGHMQDFVKHLNNDALSGEVKPDAKNILNADAAWLIGAWNKMGS